jgi:predicted secreted hydrolase
MDHQWGDFGAPKGYWNWFSIQLENNIQVVCYESGSKHHKKLLATISWADGSTTSYSNVSITEGSDSWTSPRTGASYPLSWTVVIPEAEVNLTITAKVKDHEINFWYINYWEGPSEIIALVKGEKVGGSGFIEIVGRHSKSRRYGPILSFILGQKVKDQYL